MRNREATDLPKLDSGMPLQPPPGIPASTTPTKHASRSRRWWLVTLGLGVVSSITISGFVLIQALRREKWNNDRIISNQSQAIENGKQVFLCLMEFDADYGRFPDASTAAQVRAKTGTALTLSDGSSNELFRQLLVTMGKRKTEKPFYAKIAGSHTPDDLMGDDAQALSKGECGFSYITGLDGYADAGTPVLVTPLVPGTLTFDPYPFDGYAIVIRVDCTAKKVKLDKTGHALDEHGVDVFDPAQPYWHGKAPMVKWPL